ncbi:MAG: hypothetical protein RMN51_00560 [Verrucomicrobiota bacterium]|nr:hypothetical protein [Limisphaera sp.]MDW8380591.1 hypothetical protein [Verrucomicrobiota bacterium]
MGLWLMGSLWVIGGVGCGRTGGSANSLDEADAITQRLKGEDSQSGGARATTHNTALSNVEAAGPKGTPRGGRDHEPSHSATPVDLRSLTQALRRYSAEKRRVPSSLEEIVAAGYLEALPEPPAGMRYAINPARVEVLLVKR